MPLQIPPGSGDTVAKASRAYLVELQNSAVSSANNAGTGVGIYSTKLSGVLQFKSLLSASSGLVISTLNNDVVFTLNYTNLTQNIPQNLISYSQIQRESANTLLGNSSSGTSNVAEQPVSSFGWAALNLTPAYGSLIYSDDSIAVMLPDPGAANRVLMSGGGSPNPPAWSTATYPPTAGTSGTRLKSDGTNFVNSTTTLPDSGTSGKVIIGDGTNYVESTPAFPNASATALKWMRSNGTDWIASTGTLAESAVTGGKVLISDGTNWVASTPTFPNASATTLKYIKSNGTNWVASDSTFPDSYAQGDILYGSASNVISALAKNTTATRYLSNTGSSNNPAWAQIDLSNGVTGDLPFANLTQGSALSVLGVATNGTADVASIQATSDGAVLRRSGTALDFGQVNLASANAVTGILPGANGGNWVLISSATASSSASISFTGLSSTYRAYCVVFTQVVPATDNTSLLFRSSTNNGSSYDSGATNYQYANALATSGSSVVGVGGTASAIVFGSGHGTGTGESASGFCYIIRPSDAKYSRVCGQVSQRCEDTSYRMWAVAGERATAADVDAIQFLMLSGNIASGEFHLYGLANA